MLPTQPIENTEQQSDIRNTHVATVRPSLKELAAVVAVMLLVLGFNLYHSANIEVISRDGTVYTRMAQQWGDSPSRVIENNDYHVAYPIAIFGVHSLMEALGLADSVESWDHAGQTVALMCSLATLIGVWFWVRMATNSRIAIMSILLFGISKKWVNMGSDVMSDSMAGMFYIWSFVCLYLILKKLELQKKSALCWAAVAGIMIAGGYLVRPESLVILISAVALILVTWFTYKPKWYLPIGSLLIVSATTIVASIPYMLAIGGISKKKNFIELFNAIISSAYDGSTVMLASATQPEKSWLGFARVFFVKLSEFIYPGMFVIICIWLICWIFLHKRAIWTFTPIKRTCVKIILCTCLLMSLLLAGLNRAVGYLSYRHLLMIGLLITPFIGLAVDVLPRLLRNILSRLGLKTLSPDLSVWVFVILIFICQSYHTLKEPLHSGKGVYKSAGWFIADNHEGPAGLILSDNYWPGHYARQYSSGWENTAIVDADDSPVFLQAQKVDADYIVIGKKNGFRDVPGYRLVKEFSGRKNSCRVLKRHRSPNL